MEKAKKMVKYYPPIRKKINEYTFLTLLILFIVIVGFTIMPR